MKLYSISCLFHLREEFLTKERNFGLGNATEDYSFILFKLNDFLEIINETFINKSKINYIRTNGKALEVNYQKENGYEKTIMKPYINLYTIKDNLVLDAFTIIQGSDIKSEKEFLEFI